MKVETLAEWNDILNSCGCCPMPECPVPEIEAESIEIPACGFSLPTHDDVTPEQAANHYRTALHKTESTYGWPSETTQDGTVWEGTQSGNRTTTTTVESYYGTTGCSTRTISTSDDGTDSDTYTDPAGTSSQSSSTSYNSSSSLGAACSGTNSWTLTWTGPYWGAGAGSDSGTEAWDYCETISHSPDNDWSFADLTFTRTETISGIDYTYTVTYTPVSKDDVLEDLDEKTFPDDANGSTPIAELMVHPDFEEIFEGARKCRFRWNIPEEWEGSYFKITWDVVFFPAAGGTPTAVSADATWVWSGPGDPEDPDSWKSGWYPINVPTSPGESRIVNIRFECYRSTKLGLKPQVTGEAVDLA